MTEEQHKKLKQLIKNHISYTLDDKKYNINEIASLIENTKTGYMPFHQYIGILTHLPTKLEFFEVDVFYKGDIQKYCYKI